MQFCCHTIYLIIISWIPHVFFSILTKNDVTWPPQCSGDVIWPVNRTKKKKLPTTVTNRRWSAYQKNHIDPFFRLVAEILRYDVILTPWWRNFRIFIGKSVFRPLWRNFLSKLLDILHRHRVKSYYKEIIKVN